MWVAHLSETLIKAGLNEEKQSFIAQLIVSGMKEACNQTNVVKIRSILFVSGVNVLFFTYAKKILTALS